MFMMGTTILPKRSVETPLTAVMRAAFQLAVNPGRASLFPNSPLLG
jgi:hypothetical protein